MRLRWPDGCVYRLNGEVDKIGHPYFQDAAAPKPDLLVHQPGHGNNYAIVEVKSCQAAADGIRKDVNTLSRFGNEFGYQRAIFLAFPTCAVTSLRLRFTVLKTMLGFGSDDNALTFPHVAQELKITALSHE
jgi:hypothetical protein